MVIMFWLVQMVIMGVLRSDGVILMTHMDMHEGMVVTYVAVVG